MSIAMATAWSIPGCTTDDRSTAFFGPPSLPSHLRVVTYHRRPSRAGPDRWILDQLMW